ncbi:MAG: RIP metalloprotease RseP [Anaerovoracaceae bacterium]
MTIIYAIIMFCILILIHEFGHFWVAKACGVRVNEFALGMGPVLFKRKKGETQYSLRAVPIGGFCAMEGEDEESENPRAFGNKPAWKRALILVAGSGMNLILTIVVLSAIALYVGIPTTTISSVTDATPAYEAGIKAGDTLISMDGKKINKWKDLSEILAKGGKEIPVEVDRDGKTVNLTTGKTKAEDGRAVIGVVPEVTHNPFAAVKAGTQNTWNMTVMMGTTIKQLFTGQVGVKELTGPVGIVYAVNDTAKEGIIYLFYLSALISLNLAIVNMLPLPALDGGRLVFVAIRKITGKAVTDEMEGKVHFAGILLLFGLMLYVTWNDITRFILPIFN